MKRILLNLVCGLLTFAFGVGATSLSDWLGHTLKPRPSVSVDKLDERSTTNQIAPYTIRSEQGIALGRGLRLVSDEVGLTNNILRYKISVSYPQILGSESSHIRKLNWRIKRLAEEQYWPLNPSKEDLRYYRDKWPDAFNSVHLDYEILLATDSFLSIYFEGFSYGIGAAHSVQYSFVINYDLAMGRELKLSDLFKPRSKYLEFISRYCIDELSNEYERASEFMFKDADAVAPVAENFKSWNITLDGIRFNFDACSVFSCAEGKKEVEIPFAALEPWLKPHTSVGLYKAKRGGSD